MPPDPRGLILMSLGGMLVLAILISIVASQYEKWKQKWKNRKVRPLEPQVESRRSLIGLGMWGNHTKR